MARDNSVTTRTSFSGQSSLNGAHAGITIAMLTLGGILAIAYPNPMLLPAVSGALVSAGMALALIAMLRYGAGVWQTDRLVVPALLTFLGFAASIMSDPERVVQSLRWVAG